jgi:hypothetical protein
MTENEGQGILFDTGPNPKLYRQLLEPFDSPNEANDAIALFYKGVAELRVKHGIPDVLIAVEINTAYPDGDEVAALSVCYFGDLSKKATVAAYAYGVARAEQMETNNRRVDSGQRAHRGPKKNK